MNKRITDSDHKAALDACHTLQQYLNSLNAESKPTKTEAVNEDAALDIALDVVSKLFGEKPPKKEKSNAALSLSSLDQIMCNAAELAAAYGVTLEDALNGIQLDKMSGAADTQVTPQSAKAKAKVKANKTKNKTEDDLKRIFLGTEVALYCSKIVGNQCSEHYLRPDLFDKYLTKKKEFFTFVQKYDEKYSGFKPALTESAILSAIFGKQFCSKEDAERVRLPLKRLFSLLGEGGYLGTLVDNQVAAVHSFLSNGLLVQLLLTNEADGYRFIKGAMDGYVHHTTFPLKESQFVQVHDICQPAFEAKYVTVLHRNLPITYNIDME